MWILLSLLVFIAFVFLLLNNKQNKITNQENHMIAILDYVGGIDEVLEKTTSTVKMNKNNLHINFKFKKKEIDIPVKNILSIQGKNQEQISKDITLTRLLVFGIFALGMKKTNNQNRKFITIKYLNENSEECNIIFENKYAETYIKKMKNYLEN